MKILSKKFGLCLCCMEKHEVLTVAYKEKMLYKGIPVEYDAIYDYCDKADCFIESEEQITHNHEALLESYNKVILE